jgi:hypothetical protein
MRKLFLKILLFVILIALLVISIMLLFRSDMPYLWLIGLVLVIIILIVFPYEKYFKF